MLNTICYCVLTYVTYAPDPSFLRRARTVLPNVFWHEWMNTGGALGYDEQSSGGDYNSIGSGGVGTIRPKEVWSHMWPSPNMPTTSCWITPASFNTGVLSFRRLCYANPFEVARAYTIIHICSYVITRTLMLSLERNDSAARCACRGGEGEAAAIEFSGSDGQHKTGPASSERQCLSIQRASKLSGEADQLRRHSPQQNVTPTLPPPPPVGTAAGWPRWRACTGVGPWCGGEGRASPPQQQPSRHPCGARRSQSAASCSSCCSEGTVRQILAAAGGGSWIATKPCNAHAKKRSRAYCR